MAKPNTERNTVTLDQINKILLGTKFEYQTVFGKTTIASAKLPNGFVIVESSSCVDPVNYDEKIGRDICREKIINKLWELEGYRLQDGLHRSTGERDLMDLTLRELKEAGFQIETTILHSNNEHSVGRIIINSEGVR